VAADGAPPQDDALLALYLERRANLVRFFAARAGSAAAAEDLAQELYIKLAARPPDTAAAENPLALIYRIALNLMLDRARGEARSAAREAAWRNAAHASMGGEDIAHEPPADACVSWSRRPPIFPRRCSGPFACTSSRGSATPRRRAPWASRSSRWKSTSAQPSRR
jgi:DNA-directed RNA polymerase specialized sigma24 family protein